METKKIIFVVLFFVLTGIVVSCCDCAKQTLYLYTNKNITVGNLNNAGEYIIETDSSTIVKTAFGIRLNIFAEKVACQQNNASFFINGAYANKCDCPPETQYNPKDSIVNIKIITKNNFSSSQQANSDISDYFKIYTPHQFESITNFYKKESKRFYYNEEKILQLDLLLMTPPEYIGRHQFSLEVYLSDGRILKEDTKIVELK